MQTANRLGSLDYWRGLVAPNMPGNFDNRLEWDGLTASSAAWALEPPEPATPLKPDWLPLLDALRQAARNAAREAAPDAVAGAENQSLVGRGAEQPFVHVWRPAAAWALNCLRQRCGDLSPELQLAESAWLDLGEALLERVRSVARLLSDEGLDFEVVEAEDGSRLLGRGCPCTQLLGEHDGACDHDRVLLSRILGVEVQPLRAEALPGDFVCGYLVSSSPPRSPLELPAKV